jgi:chitin disaccharide deacetylase
MYINWFFRTVSIMSVILTGATSSLAETSTYAERLGWPAGTKAVILHVDDAGRSHGSNLGTIRALEEGVGTSTSIMMPRPGVEEFVEYVKAHPQVDAGLHLDVTRGTAPDAAENEISAQIDKALSMGILPTHLDSEGAMQFNTQYTDRFVKVAIEKKTPLLFYGGHMQNIGGEAGSNKQLFLSIAQKLWASGLPVIDDILAQRSHSSDYEERKANLIKLLNEMKPGITEIIFHCSMKTDDPKTDDSSGNPGPGQDMSLEGEMDVRLLTDPDIRAFIKSEGIVLTTWRELMKRRALVQN